VESIAQMKPKAATEHDEGLLEYLEDIIGTNQYKEPIEEALGEMEKYSEERGEKVFIHASPLVLFTTNIIIAQ
jgi:structural maintenance of chromosome 4